MKRALSSVIFAGATVFALAQGSFTIVRPFDGSKIRETVHVMFPKNSIPEDSGYVGIFIDGEFIEAVAPKLSADKKYYEYLLNTKDLSDGQHKLEAKLYVDYSNQPRIVDTSSVDITVANKTSIPVPDEGFQIRYHFNTGTEHIYRIQEKVIQNMISEDQQKIKDSRPMQLEEDGESMKMLYACDNSYGNGDGLIRMQVVPDKGIRNREYAYISVANSNGPQKFYSSDMAAIYMRITPTGREVFGSVPEYFGLEGNTGTQNRLLLYADYPLPTLPTKGVRPGDTWQTNFQRGAINLENPYIQDSVVRKLPARGELLGVEWEMGHPCAKIKNSIAIGSGDTAKKTPQVNGVDKISDAKYSIEETVWFALDTGVPVKFYRDITVEGKGDFGLTVGGNSGGAGGSGGPQGPSAAGQSGGGNSGGKDPRDFHIGNFQRGGAPVGGPQGGPSRGGPTGAPSGGPPQGFGPNGPGGFGQQNSISTFVRIRIQQLFVLEK
ncbi:MAG: hypothetical protein JST12_11720 [Armatimonadetes bacterium]|nr:hypothetical protein [Armatimonadota bacterium]